MRLLSGITKITTNFMDLFLDCGDLSDVKAAGVEFAPESDCDLPCPGDPIHLCGAGNRIQYYVWTGAPPYVWNNPQNKGYYDVSDPV